MSNLHQFPAPPTPKRTAEEISAEIDEWVRENAKILPTILDPSTHEEIRTSLANLHYENRVFIKAMRLYLAGSQPKAAALLNAYVNHPITNDRVWVPGLLADGDEQL